MRICFITETIGDVFGQERVVRVTAEWLRAQGHEVFFVSAQRTHPIPESDGEIQIEGLFSLSLLASGKKLIPCLEATKRFITRTAPHLVHFVDVPHYRISRWIIENFCTVMTAHTVAPTCPASHRLIRGFQSCQKKSGWSCLVHNAQYQCLSQFRNDAHRAYAIADFLKKKAALKQASAITAISKYVQKTLVFDGFPPDRVSLLYNPVQVMEGIPKAESPDAPLIVTACRLVPLKGVDHLLQALEQIQNIPWTLAICGDGPERERLVALAEKLKIQTRVRFLGRLPHDKLLSLLRSATLYAQPNVGPEGFGLAVAEASAMGLPIAAYDTPALDEVICQNETGLLAPTGDIGGLAKNIQQLLTDETAAQEMGRAGGKFIQENFSADSYGKNLLKVYDQALKNSKHPRESSTK